MEDFEVFRFELFWDLGCDIVEDEFMTVLRGSASEVIVVDIVTVTGLVDLVLEKPGEDSHLALSERFLYLSCLTI